MGLTNTTSEILPGTLDMLILKAVSTGPKHGYAIVETIRRSTRDALQVGESALYPALQRLLMNGHVTGAWGPSENNRRARFYTLTPLGRKQLTAEQKKFERLVGTIRRALDSI